MDVSTITVAQFQAQFFRDFPYFDSIQYNPAAIYNCDDEVYYPSSKLFWKSIEDGVSGVAPGTDGTKWVKFPDNVNNYIQDQDITNAFAEALVAFNPALFTTDANQQLGFLYLTAFFLCEDLKRATGGISAQSNFPMSGRSVGSVSENYQVPDAFKDSPILAAYTANGYGLKYISLALPNMTGNMAAVWGGSHA